MRWLRDTRVRGVVLVLLVFLSGGHLEEPFHQPGTRL
jgi:hypothetical protein